MIFYCVCSHGIDNDRHWLRRPYPLGAQLASHLVGVGVGGCRSACVIERLCIVIVRPWLVIPCVWRMYASHARAHTRQVNVCRKRTRTQSITGLAHVPCRYVTRYKVFN